MEVKYADELDCDFAEFYGVHDRQALPLQKAAAFAAGLPPESRVKRQLSGAKTDLKTLLLAMAADRLGELVWAKTKDGQKGRNRPKGVLRLLLEGPERTPETVAFDTPEEFERARNAIIGK